MLRENESGLFLALCRAFIDQVKRVTGLNPMILARANMPSMGMQFVPSQTDASANVVVPVQPNNSHFSSFYSSYDIWWFTSPETK